MQTRRTNLNHHHQDRFVIGVVSPGPVAELIALARSKGQVLTEHTLRLLRNTLELRGVTLEAFVADIRPHFRNNILNPSGFLIDRARRFVQLSRPAVVPISSTAVATDLMVACGGCKGEKFVLAENEVKPCPECSTAEFTFEFRDLFTDAKLLAWQAKEAARARRIATENARRLKAISE